MKLIIIYICLLMLPCHIMAGEDIQYEKWTTSKPLFTSRVDHPLDNIAVKDPSIVFYNGNYHLFYTAKSVQKTDNGFNYEIGTAYTSAPTLEELNNAKRYSINSIVNDSVVAPQIFYFEPHNLWYLIAHTWIDGDHHNLEPIYMTNPDIEDIHGWSKVKKLDTEKSEKEFWIDFWVICDDQDAYLFYTNQIGSLLQMKTSLDNFPFGFKKKEARIALTETGNKDGVNWKMFEAAHVYYVKKENKYIALLEGAYDHPIREGDIDSRNRFIFAMTSDSLNGRWTRIENSNNDFLADAQHIYNEDGSHAELTQVSHPELIRAGYNQKLEIEDFKLCLMYQSFDGTEIPDTYHYNELPWALFIMKNY